MYGNLLVSLFYVSFVMSAASFFAPPALCRNTYACVTQIPSKDALFLWTKEKSEIAAPPGRFRFLNQLNMRRGGGGTSRLKKKSTKPQFFGVDVSVTNALIAVNAIVFLTVKKYPNVLRKLMKFDRAISNGQTYRIFSSLFLHKALYHVGANSYSLYQIGPGAEKIFGSSRFFCTYIFSGALANIATYILKSSPASLGASGCTFGIIGAFATHFYRNRAIIGKAESDAALSNIKRTVFINLMYGFSMQNIDNGAHIGGFLAGALFAYLFGPRYFINTTNGWKKVLVDRPLVPYTKYWKMIIGTGPKGNQPNMLASGSAGQTAEINFTDDVYSTEDEFSSDSSGRKETRLL